MSHRGDQAPAHVTLPETRILFGAAYYPEYVGFDRLERDLDLMRAASVTVIRMGESVWSTWEPRDGEFDLEWIGPALDAAHARGIRVILGTPTYAIPPWMQRAHPEFAAERADGSRIPWGGRQEIDLTNDEFFGYCERVIRAILGRWAEHPAIIGFQVDNEPGLHLLHNDAVFARFVQSLRDEFGDVDALNEAWGLTYWSHRLTDFDELWRPAGNTIPQYDLAWRRFQGAEVARFIGRQAAIVREYATGGRFVTTCLALTRVAMDEVRVANELDVASVNLYYGTQDHLDARLDLAPVATWVTTGVWGLLLSADRSYAASGGRRFLVAETNAQSIGGSDLNLPPYPGQLRQVALALVARGAAMIEYWHWNTLTTGTEMNWGGVLPHSGEPGRIYDEVAALGSDLDALGPLTAGFRPDADVGFVVSGDSRWFMEFEPPVPSRVPGPRADAYDQIIAPFYRGLLEAGAQVRLVHDTDLAGYTPDALVAAFPVLVAAGLGVADDATLALLRAYADAGGHLVLGPRTATGDELGRARSGRLPEQLTDAAGVGYSEWSNLAGPVEVTGSAALAVSTGAAATLWADGLVPADDDEAAVLAGYRHPFFGSFAAVTTRAFGAGRVSVVGTVPDRVFARDLAEAFVPDRVAAVWRVETPVMVTSGRNASGARLWFVHNWSGEAVRVIVPVDVVDLLGAPTPAHTEITIDAWGAHVYIQQDPHEEER
ncbi:beta-galactosidase [Agromyces atrinae]|uniref:beta-galactosidase n=1 Tax=Agromyces atrinae TaxID=592376 RepID=A0A4Q2M7M4_9MICO|nr:beta-galactosidase [Agromyces atrinae]